MSTQARAPARWKRSEPQPQPEPQAVAAAEQAARRVIVVVPAYNEAENLAEVVPSILAEVRSAAGWARVLVVDDGSKDATREVMSRLADEHDGVDTLSFARNRGKAAVLKDGFQSALDAGATHVIMMDADGQDDPAELVRLLDALDEGADLVTGARHVRHDRFVKRHTSRLYNRVTGMLSGTPGSDLNSGFKAMKADVARDVSPMLYGELHRYLTVISHWLGYRVAEVPVQHHRRLHGKSKYGLARFWRGFLDLLTVRFLMSYEHRPSHLFSGLGTVCLLAGGGILVYLTILKLSGEGIGDRPLLQAGILLAVVGVQLILFGLLAELIVYVRNAARRSE